MKRKRFLLGRGACLSLLFTILLVFGAANTYALPLTNVQVTYGGASFGGWATVYNFNADEIDGPYAAFCVDPASLNTSYDYELISVPSQLNIVAKFADHFFEGVGGFSASQRDYQIAIWDQLGIKDYASGIDGVDNILAGLGVGGYWENYSRTGLMSLAHSPIGGVGGGDSQDYLIGASVPEPATLLLLGTGMLGIAIVGRKKRFKK